MSISRQLKRAIKTSGKSAYRLGKESGVSASVISRWLAGDRDSISLTTAEKLCNVLKLELRSKD